MSLIIAATDFSTIGRNAVNYACELATAHDSQLIVLHSYMLPIMFSDVQMPVSLINDTQHDAEDQMASLVEALSAAYPGLNIKGNTTYGSFIDAIEDYTEEHGRPLLIIVGNSSAGDLNTWPDSTLTDAFTKIHYPVLAIPAGTPYKPLQKICLAFDNKHSGNHTAFRQLMEITAVLNAELHVLNIQPDVANQDNKPDIDEEAKILLGGPNTKFHLLYDSPDVNKGIESFIEKNKMDVLAMIPRKHSFFEGLFHKSHTKAISHHSHIPILALQDSAE
jgi:nucleotide-binding universal stress UspA family protein